MKTETSIRKKLLVCFAAILVLSLVMSYNSLSVTRGLGADLDRAVNITGATVEHIGRLTTSLSEMKASLAGFILFSSLDDHNQMDANKGAFRESASVMSQMIGQVRPNISDRGAADALSALEQGHSSLVQTFDQMVQLCASMKCSDALTLHVSKALPLIAEMNRAASELAAGQRRLLADADHQASAKSTRGIWIASLLIALTLAIGGAVFVVLYHVSSRLHQFATNLSHAADEMFNASAQVSSASQGLAHGASEQAAALRDTASSAGQIASMTKQNAESTRSAAQLVLDGDKRVGEANRTLQTMVTSMGEINASSEKISRIIKVIEEIAFQTNILALNAAVEAARAGDAGMGFAVVADEVRNLAQRCSEAARDTASLIEESLTRSHEGSTNMNQVTAAIAGITQTSEKIRALVDEVNSASQEQAKGIDQVSRAVGRMNEVTQQTAASAEESASVGEEMSAQAKSMQSTVRELLILVGGR